MSNFRRNLMVQDPLTSCTTKIDYYYDTTETTIELPNNALAMDIFLVGGGGGGGQWNTWGCVDGTLGLGGECFCKRRIPLNNVTYIKIQCGKGGIGTLSSNEGAYLATDGGNTILTTNIETFTAIGGYGGRNSENLSKLTITTLPNGELTYYVDFFGRATKLYGHDNRVMTKYGLEGGYMEGLRMLVGKYWIGPNTFWENEESVNIYNLILNVTYPNVVDVYDFGIPAFFEEGQETFGALGVGTRNTRNRTTIGPIGDILTNSSESITKGKACGYGGGGHGGTMRYAPIKNGSDGTSGAVVIRWYLNK